MKYPLQDEIAVISGAHSFLLIAKAGCRFPLCIESSAGEIVQAVDPSDLIVVSAPEGGPVEPGIFLVELLRKHHFPLVVLPKEHPGSKRVSYVVSVGPVIRTSCSIRRGTHPEQDIVCSGNELNGIALKGTGDGFEASLPENVHVKMLKYSIHTEFS